MALNNMKLKQYLMIKTADKWKTPKNTWESGGSMDPNIQWWNKDFNPNWEAEQRAKEQEIPDWVHAMSPDTATEIETANKEKDKKKSKRFREEVDKYGRPLTQQERDYNEKALEGLALFQPGMSMQQKARVAEDFYTNRALKRYRENFGNARSDAGAQDFINAAYNGNLQKEWEDYEKYLKSKRMSYLKWGLGGAALGGLGSLAANMGGSTNKYYHALPASLLGVAGLTTALVHNRFLDKYGKTPLEALYDNTLGSWLPSWFRPRDRRPKAPSRPGPAAPLDTPRHRPMTPDEKLTASKNRISDPAQMIFGPLPQGVSRDRDTNTLRDKREAARYGVYDAGVGPKHKQ